MLKKKKIPIALSFYIMLFIITALLYVVAASSSNVAYSSFLDNRYQKLCKTACETVVSFVGTDEANEYLNGKKHIEHIRLCDNINSIKENIPYIDNIIVYKVSKDGLHIVCDANSYKKRSGLGEIIGFNGKWSKYKEDLLAGKDIEKAVVQERKGIINYHCSPVGDDIYIAVGISENLIASEKNAFMKNIGALVGFFSILVFLLAALFLNKKAVKIVKQVQGLLEKANKHESDGFLEKISNNEIKSGNELENLYKNFVKIYFSKVRLDAAISKTDSGSIDEILDLIKRMDNYTRLHLDNSIRYLVLLINEMRNRDKYKELISDKDFENLILAAPLHDVGKLVIPREIMQKPGRFTDEEYEIAKKHSFLGSKVIEEMYQKNNNEEYLEVARIIALYHHEKWDGTGYPEGLKGEEIPLAARIMAVCDVFDAVLSKRVYKEAYSFADSFKIIEDGRGSFFDPDIVDVFVESKDKIYKLYTEITEG